MNPDIYSYDNYFFDCDGVLIDSNAIKTDAFFECCLPYGIEAAKKMVEYHKINGGVSRFEKFNYFFSQIINISADQFIIEKTLKEFSKICKIKLQLCDLNQGVQLFLKHLSTRKNARFVISGGLHSEVIDILNFKQIGCFFHGIYGSPKTKFEIISSLNPDPTKANLFLGDSKLDYEVAKHFNFDFIFLSDHSEFNSWQEYFYNIDNQRVKIATNFLDLIQLNDTLLSRIKHE